MTQQPQDSPQVFDGTDIEVAPEEVDGEEQSATSDAEAFLEEDETLGGTGGVGAGGAG
jgi:hypothetical protein